MDGIQAATELQDSNDDELKEKIATQSMQRYNQVPKPPQVNTVVNLLLGQNTFLLAATGFGKSRISELYLEMLPKDRNRNIYGLVAVLNPLDALGNNQVEEKNQAASTSINLKKSPKICIIGIPMESSIQSSKDALKVYGPKAYTPGNQMVPSVICSRTWAHTLQVLEVLDQARETTNNHLNPHNLFALRYHACTGELDKKDAIEDFTGGKVPVLSCTLALGMGKNWNLVRQVVHIGCGDSSLICQMVGQCSRDGQPGLAVLFVESNGPKGKNSVADFVPGQKQSDKDWMEALAVTPVCLHIAFSMDNIIGYIPLDFNDPQYQAEKHCEQLKGFAVCMCSNCMEYVSATLVQNLRYLYKVKFTDYILNRYELTAEATRETKRKYTTTQNGPITNKQNCIKLEPLKGLLQEIQPVLLSKIWPRRTRGTLQSFQRRGGKINH
ncbi:hypothetical protein MJO29_010374 [Puccinia striiformis f. sp. tritici]|nr:hypothetical protein MJO29_010374 [Puccinia striiformis f. sp. tritici]